MTRIWLLALVFGMVSEVAHAQTHPCDITPVANPSAQSPVKFGFCVPLTDTTTITAYKLYLDNSTTAVYTGLVAPTGTANATGLVFIQLPAVSIVFGAHSAQVSAVNAVGEGAKSVAYPFVVASVPDAPVKMRIVP